MNSTMKKFLQNLSYSFIANLIVMFISIISLLIIPKFIGVENYGYWQLYVFYTSFISYLSLGLTDGAYLRFGGMNYKDLKKPVLVSQFWFLVAFDILANISIILVYFSVAEDPNKQLIILLTCLTGVLTVPRSLLTFMLQSTNRIKEYSFIIIIERTVYFALVIIILLSNRQEFIYLILADIIGKIISMTYALYVCKELAFGKFASLHASFKEIFLNISVGIKLLISNLAGILILGIARFSIETNWGIEIFGKVSLSLSITTMLMFFVNSVAIILFPTLRRIADKSLAMIYENIRILLMVFLFGVLVLYYPASLAFSYWLPEYSSSFTYLALLFPMCIYESKMVLLINTYLKTLRKEKAMLLINLLTLTLSAIFMYISVIIMNNLNLTILSLTILLALRSIIAELYLSKLLNISIKRYTLIELFMSASFLIISWYLGLLNGVILYSLIYIIYLLTNKNNFRRFSKLRRSFLNA